MSTLTLLNFIGSKTPPAPVLSYTVLSPTSTSWSWTSNYTGSFVFQRSTDNMFVGNLITIYSGSGMSVNDTNMVAGTTYHYRIVQTVAGYNNTAYGIKCAMSGTPTSSIAVNNNNINGGYAVGAILTFAPGTYQTQITVQNLTGVTLDLTGVILDGGSFPYNGGNVLNIQSCNNILIKGLRTQNCSNHAGTVTGKFTGVYFDGLIYDNCYQAVQFSNSSSINWDGTDSTVTYFNISFLNTLFNNMSNDPTVSDPNGNGNASVSFNNGIYTSVSDLSKNLLIAGNSFVGGNPGNMLSNQAIDKYLIHNNLFSGLNHNLTYDTRLCYMGGNGDVSYNRVDNCRGHFAACFGVSFGTIKKVSNFHHNVVTNSLRYSSFEFQEFSYNYDFNTRTLTCDLNVYNNTVGNLNIDNWLPIGNASFYTGFLDNYGSSRGALISLTNNLGWDWNHKADNIVWNLATPSTVTNNQYVLTQDLAIDPNYNTQFTGIGAY